MLRHGTLLLSLALFSAGVLFADDEPESHAATCPQNCAKCDSIVRKSLDWLASQQLAEGNWKAGNGGMWTATSFAVIAFHAHGSTVKEGPYAKHLEKALNYIIEQAPIAQKKYPLMNWDVAYMTLAVAEAHAQCPHDKYKKFLEWAADLIGKNQQIPSPSDGRGGWGHLSVNYGIRRELTMYGMFVAPSMWTVAALGILRDLGIKVDDEMFQRGVTYLRCAVGKDGGVGYYGVRPSSTNVGGMEAGRTGGTLWALDRAGATDHTIYPRMKDWFIPRMKSVPYGHAAVILHYLHGALAVKLIGEPARSDYWKLWRDQMLKEQMASGGFQNRWIKEDKFRWWGEIPVGNNFSSAVYPLIFMILGDTSKLKTWFSPVKPSNVPIPEALAARFNAPAAPPPKSAAEAAPQNKAPVEPHDEPSAMAVNEPSKIVIPRPPPRPDARPWLGANFQEIEGRGLMVVAVAEEGSLARAGIEAGDIITQFNNQPATKTEEISALLEAVKVGDTVPVKFLRGKAGKTVDLKIVGEP